MALTEEHIAHRLQAVFATPTFRVFTHHDVVGCELGGALKNVYAIAPPTSTAEALGSRFSIAATLSETFAPPSTTTNGLAGLVSASLRNLISFSTRNPETLGPFTALGTATMDASGRWQVPKASLT